MAVYQYYLAVIPLKGIIRKHGFVPNKINVSTETGYFESEAKNYWQEINLKPQEIVSQMDSIIKRANWGNDETSFNWKYYTDDVDNDAAIYLDENLLVVNEFSFRFDLREENLNFLKRMIELGRVNQWLFMDRNGKLFNPDFEEMKNSIQDSNAYRFLEDPHGFLDDLNSLY